MAGEGGTPNTWVCHWLPRLFSKVLIFSEKAFRFLSDPSVWREIKKSGWNSEGRMSSPGSVPSPSVCRAGEVWPQVQPGNTRDPGVTRGEGTGGSRSGTSSGRWSLGNGPGEQSWDATARLGGGQERWWPERGGESQKSGLRDRQTDRKGMVTGVIGPAPGIRMSRKKGLPSALGSGAEYWR